MAEVQTEITPAVTKVITPAYVAVSLSMNEAEAVYCLAVLGCGAQWATGPQDKNGSVYETLRNSLEYVVDDLDEKERIQTEQHLAYLNATLGKVDETPYVWQTIGAGSGGDS